MSKWFELFFTNGAGRPPGTTTSLDGDILSEAVMALAATEDHVGRDREKRIKDEAYRGRAIVALEGNPAKVAEMYLKNCPGMKREYWEVNNVLYLSCWQAVLSGESDVDAETKDAVRQIVAEFPPKRRGAIVKRPKIG